MHDTGSFFSSDRRRSSSSSASRSSILRTSGSSSHLSDETPVRRRDTVTITTAELGKIFDAFNSVSAQLKIQGQVLEHVKNSLEDVTAELQESKEDRRILMERIENYQQEDAANDEKIPPEISADVHLLHNSLTLDQQYKPEQSVLSPHNTRVRHELEDQVALQEKGYPLRLIKRAVVRYYKTKRKLYLQALPENKEKAERQKQENKLRSRRKRLFNARLKVSSGQDKQNMEMLNFDYVSDEENGSGENKGKWIVRRPIWRSQRATVLMERLQQKINEDQKEDARARVPRADGPPSERQRPKVQVSWALSSQHEPEEPVPGTDQVERISREEPRDTHSQQGETQARQHKRRRQEEHNETTRRRIRQAASSDSESDSQS